MNPQLLLKVALDYVLVAVFDQKAYAEWLMKHLGASLDPTFASNDETFFLQIPGIPSVCKITGNKQFFGATPALAHLPLRVPRADFDEWIERLIELGCDVTGKEHYRLIQVRVLKGTEKIALGTIHLAYRD